LETEFTLPGLSGFVWSLAINPRNPDELAVGTRDGTVTIWNLRTSQAQLSFKLGKSDITALAFQPDAKLLAVAADGYKVFLFDPKTGQKMGQAFREHDGPVTALVFSPDGQTLLSASSDFTIVIHNMDPLNWQEHACRVANRKLDPAEWNLYISKLLPYQIICPGIPID
jgi:WD40 repeat protein